MSRNTQAAENRKWLEHALSRYKELGLQTFIAKYENDDYTYGLITDGNDMITLSITGYRGLSVSYNYIPSRKTGSACSICDGLALNDDILTLETFHQWVKEGRSLAYRYGAELYCDTGKRTAFDQYQQKSKTFKLYKEV